MQFEINHATATVYTTLDEDKDTSMHQTCWKLDTSLKPNEEIAGQSKSFHKM